MSMTTETLKANWKEPAVFCCRRRKGTVISAADLEDPGLFDDMAESGLLTLSDGALTVGEALGATLLADCEALTPILPSMVQGARKAEKAEPSVSKEPEAPAGITYAKGAAGMLHIEIKSLEGLSLDLPWGGSSPLPTVPAAPAAEPAAVQGEDKTLRTLTKKYFQVNDVTIGEKTSFENGVLTLNRELLEQAIQADPLVKEIKMDVIKPAGRHIYTDTIMDVCPIAAKVSGALGEGVTHVIEGAVFMLTGVDEDGTQVHEFGSSEGYLDEKMAFGNPGCADEGDIIIRVETKIQRHTGMERRGPLAAHKCEDVVIQAARDVLKTAAQAPLREEICRDVKKHGRPRVVLVKEIMGQGAMHDNILCPNEPCGVTGGQKNVDLGNVPVMLSPNEVLDGGIHALTCIGPSTKEMTRHYFREPLVRALAEDEELNLVGVVFVGSPQVNDEKAFVSERLGAWMETLEAEGAIVTTEGFGNNHIDFISHIDQIGRRGIPVVGVSFCAYQGQLVVGNRYADAMIELNKDPEGFENEIAGCSEICPNDALRTIQMLKNKMMGVEIKPAPKKWSQQVVDGNNQLLGL